MPGNSDNSTTEDDHSHHIKNCRHNIKAGRNLVVCIDGTSKQFGTNNTNVVKLYNLILKGKGDGYNQRTWYNSGIGTYARPSRKTFEFYKKVLHHKLDSVFAWGFERTILAAYRWLSDNYEPGDCIFLFGFSRGAFQVRVLSAMIDKVGLICRGNEMQIPFAYELYENPQYHTLTQDAMDKGEKYSSADNFKRTFSYDVKVHFVGAWDTVSSIGMDGELGMNLPGTNDGMQHVCYFRHALALDERRVRFQPEFAYGHSGWKRSDEESEHLTSRSPHVLEVWFAGTHSDIGGGKDVKNAVVDCSLPPLQWMMHEAERAGLRMALLEHKPSFLEADQLRIKESVNFLWWLLEILPLRQIRYPSSHQVTHEKKTTTHMPHLGAYRRIHDGQKIHASVKRLLMQRNYSKKNDYVPSAWPLAETHETSSSFWIGSHSNLTKWLQRDFNDFVNDLVQKFVEKYGNTESQHGDSDHTTIRHRLDEATSSDNGKQMVCKNLYQEIISFLGNQNHTFEMKYQLLRSAVDILKKSPYSLKREYSAQIIEKVLHSGDDTDRWNSGAAKKILAQCTDPCIHVFHGYTATVNCVAFSPDDRRIISGTADATIQIWDLNTVKRDQYLQFRENALHTILSVAFSPDSKLILFSRSTRDHHKISFLAWDLERGDVPFEQAISGCVSFLSDSKHIILGSTTEELRVWNLKSNQPFGEPITFTEYTKHSELATSIAFSPDGKHIALGLNSSPQAVEIWDLDTKTRVAGPLKGHTDKINFVAFSPRDGKHLVSGSSDGTLRIWNLDTKQQAGPPVHTDRRHEEECNVALSPDGKHIVTAGRDHTIRVWDTDTGTQVGQPLLGHTHPVKSVAFSHEGKHIVSGSHDKTVRVWDLAMFKAVA